MKCHQILTGAVNSGDNTYSSGSVEGIHFTAYCSGCNIVILSARFERVQIVPGVLHGGNVQANCIDAGTDVGKIAVCYGGPIKCHQTSGAGAATTATNATTTTTTTASSPASNRIFIYEPTPIIGQVSEHRLDYSWIKTAEIEPNSAVSVLSWNIEGTRLLTGGVEIQLWQLASQPQPHTAADSAAAFGGKPLTPTPSGGSDPADQGLRMKPLRSTTSEQQQQPPPKSSDWSCVWSCKTSSPVAHLSFSPDGTLFCSTGRADRLVKIWFEAPTQSHHFTALFDQQGGNNSSSMGNFTTTTTGCQSSSANSQLSLSTTSGHGSSPCALSFSFIYVAHPRAVTGISWRQVSKYMPRGSVANMLVTSCRDNICRLWVQTLLPEDGLVNVSQLEGVGSLVTPREQTARHRAKLMARFRHMKSFTNFKRRAHIENAEAEEGGGGGGGSGGGQLGHSHSADAFLNTTSSTGTIFNPNLPSTFSVHDFHGFGVHGTAVAPGGLHFHLTATINAENDIPLVPSLTQHPSESNLVAAVAAAAQGGTATTAGNPRVSVTNEEPRATSPSSSTAAPHHHLHSGQQAAYHHHEESDKPLFVVNWLNNKEMAYTQGAERVLHEIVANILESERQVLLQQQQQQQQLLLQQQQQDQQSEATSTTAENTTVENVRVGAKSSPRLPGAATTAASTPGAKSGEMLAEFAAASSSHNSSSTNSLATMTTAAAAAAAAAAANAAVSDGGPLGELVNRRTVADYLDRKLETLMRDWHTTSDLLYSIHPLDGSLLVWLVEWLDEPTPSTFRQPQISFSARIPNSIPLWDASTMSHHIRLYSPHCFLDLKSVLQSSVATFTSAGAGNSSNAGALLSAVLGEQQQQQQQQQQPSASAISLAHKSQQQHYQSQQPLFGTATGASSTLCMITKHNNGSLNLWNLFFAEQRGGGGGTGSGSGPTSSSASAPFTQVLSLAHSRRVCGHRFRVNDVSCHPILPLLLTTSHHNSPAGGTASAKAGTTQQLEPSGSSSSNLISGHRSSSVPNSGFCSELILWKVDSVGPLLKSGGVTELARINSLESTAFANVAWVPTLLPSTALGAIAGGHSSASACFVASDGRQLRIYQAVIDARSLLAEAQRYMLNTNDQRRFYYDSSEEEEEEEESDYESEDEDLEDGRHHRHHQHHRRHHSHHSQSSHHHQHHHNRRNLAQPDQDAFRSLFKIVSLQSTARPGAVLELSPIVDARQDWAKTQLLHVFQEQLILGNQMVKPAAASGSKSGSSQKDAGGGAGIAPEISLPDGGPVIDLCHGLFEEVFYLVVVEKTAAAAAAAGDTRSTLHMWRLVISSRGKASLDDIRSGTSQAASWISAAGGAEDGGGESSRSVSPEFAGAGGGSGQNHQPNNGSSSSPLLRIKTRKVTTQVLPLPADVEVIHAAPAAGHLPSSNIYPACYAPFLLTTACSDNKVRFWRCQVTEGGTAEQTNSSSSFTWLEWEMHLKATKPKETTTNNNKTSMDLGGAEPIQPEMSSALELPGSPLYVACAYSGRIAVAFKYGHSYTAAARGDGNKRFINIGIAVYECQSSGGSDWILEDTIKVERIPLLEQTDVVDGDVAAEEDLIASQNVAYDLGPLVDKTLKNQQASLSLTTKIASSGASPSNPFLSANSDHQQHHSSASFEGALEEGSGGGGSSNHRVANIQRLLAVPSYTTIQSLRRLIAEQGNQPGSFTQKSPVLLDWVSTEDGSHLLTASAGHKVALFAPVTQRKSVAAVAATATTTTEANRQAAAPRTSTTSSTTSTLIPQQSFGGPGGGGGGGSTSSPSSFTRQTSQLLYNHSSAAGGPGGSHISVTRWMVLRVAELASVDGLPPLPMQLSWVRDGILVVGMDNEMLIYTQWKRAGPPALVGGSAQSSAAAAEKTATSNSRQQQRPLATTAAAAVRRYPFDSVDLPAERFVATSSSAGAKDATEATSNEKNNIISSGEHQPDDYGLFEAFRLSSPVIPQYHPRQLMELLAFGKIHRVRAILSHLVASLCSIGGSKEGYNSYNPANMGGPHGGGSSFENDARSPRAWTRTRALSIAQQPSPHESGGGTGGGGAGGSSVSPGLDGHTNPIVAEEIQLDYTEIASIRPLPLYALLQADEGVSAERTKAMEEAKAKAKQAANKVAGGRGAALGSSSAFTLDGAEALDADALFEDLYSYKTQVEETLDEFLGNRTAFNFSNLATSKFLKSGGGGGDGAAASANAAAAAAAGDAYYEGELHISIHFDQRQAALLSKLLTHSHLPGLSSLDQMHLLALADSLASFSDLADKSGGGGGANAGDSLSSTPATAEPSYHPTEDGLLTISANSLDDCGLRYLLNMRQHVYLLRCLPLMQRKALQAAGLGLHNIIWAFHSETQEELVQLVTMPANPTAAAAGGANPALKSITWAELREVGVGYWVRNNALLRKVIERLAKAAFKARNDPLDAALYYMAMRKKNLVWGLYRSVQDRKMTDFFSHDFGEDKWRKAALKNAYALMGKQRFEHAVAFFLLAGSLWDAVEVCLNRLDDLQLAMVIVRLYDGGDIETVPETLKRMLQEEILGYRQGGTVQDRQLAHPDPFLRSMAYWMLHEYNLALSTLLEVGDVGSRHPKTVEAMNSSNSGGGGGGGGRSTYATPQPPPTSTGNAEEDGSVGSNFEGLHPAVFNFYLYLRTQPLIVRRAQVAQHNIGTTVGSSTAAAAGALGAGAKKFTRSTSTAKNEPAPQSKKSHLFSGATNRADAIAITAFERRLFFLTAHRHLRAGCPALALEVLSRLPANILSYSEKSELEECSRRMSLPEAALRLADDGHLPQAAKLAVATPSKAEDLFSGGGGGGGGGGFDWGAPTSSLFEPTTSSLFAPTEEEEFKITFDDDEKSEDDEDEDEGGLQMKAPEKEPPAETAEAAPAADSSSKDQQQQQTKIDVMAQQFKFIACLKILMEELSTLATGFEVDGGQLRYQLYIWLERSVTILKETVNYHTFSLRSSSSEGGGGGRTGSIDHSSAGGLVPLSPPKSSSGGSVLVNATTTTTSAAANRSSLSRKHSDNPHHQQQQEAAAHQQLPPTAHPQPPLPSLHDILLADKADFESKMERCRRRKSWLLANEALLRNLLSYCSLHGAHGGGLASVRMELILLLQELQQDRTPQQQLLSPLPLPTTLPLLTASVASQKTVVADPIRYLQSTIHDILGSLAEIATYVHMPTRSEYSSGSGGSSLAPVRELLALPPFMVSGTATALTAWAVSFQQQQQGQGQSNLQPNSSNVQEQQQQQHSYASSLYSLVHILRDLGISLSSCVYQSLCDCDTVMQNVAGGGGGGGGRTSKSSSSRAAPRPPPPPQHHQQLTATRSTGSGSNPSGEQLPGGAATSSASSELLINGGVGSSSSSNEPLVATSPPSKWPGVQSLQALIVREKDEDLPKLHTLLCEAYVAVYLSQLVYALTICDAGILFRLVGLRFTERSWADLFGGGVKRLLCYVSAASVGGPSGLAGGGGAAGGGAVPAGGAPVSPNDLLNGGAPHNDLLNTLSKQRMKLHMKILEQLNQASGAMQAAGAAAVDVVSAVSTGMVNVATSPSSTFTSLGNQFGGGGGGGAVPGSAASSSSSAAATVPATAEQRPTYRETFVPPAVSLVNYLMSKPELADELRHLDYDSNASEGEEGEDFEDGGIGGKFRSELAAKSGGEKQKDDDDEPDDEEYDNWANEGGGSGTTGAGGSKKKSKQDLAAEKRKANLEYDLYAWCIIRLAVARLAYEQLDRFLTVSGLEKGDLPTTSPAIHAMLKTLKRWQYSLAFYMNEFTHLPDRFLPNMYVDGEKTAGPVIAKYKSLLETNNTPFRGGGGGGSGSSSCSLKANKRLWNYLVRQRSVQDVFIRYIYAKAKAAKLARDHGATAICNSLSGSALNESAGGGGGGGSSEGGNTASDQKTMQPGSDREDAQQQNQQNQQQQQPELATFGGPMGRRMPDPLRIVHKDQDQITAFCLNRSSSPGLLAISTQKEIQELNIRPLLDACVPWLEEDTEMDILNLRQKHDLAYSTSSYVDFLLVQHPSDRLQTSPGGQAMGRQQPLSAGAGGAAAGSQQTPTKQPVLSKHHFQGHTNPYFCQIIFERSRQIFMPLKRHKTETVRRLASHPSLPLYLSGGQDGSVVLWEFNHQLPISTPRSPGTFAKVTRVAFNQQGNKFGVADTDGNLSLWQVLAGHSQPYFTYLCHNKTISDFTFLGSSSLVMTAGHSADHRNVVLWDTLMPTKKCLVSSFGAHEHGAASIAYGPLNQIVITGGKKGEVAIYDMRQRLQRDRFQAHEGGGSGAAVKAIALDPGEEFFATGSADGDIKVWSLTGATPRQLLFSFPAEHTRSTFFRSMTAGTTGVSQLYIDGSGRLFSCGADGSLKMRHIPTVESQPRWFFAPGSPSTQQALFGGGVGLDEYYGGGFRGNEHSFINGNGVVSSYY